MADFYLPPPSGGAGNTWYGYTTPDPNTIGGLGGVPSGGVPSGGAPQGGDAQTQYDYYLSKIGQPVAPGAISKFSVGANGEIGYWNSWGDHWNVVIPAPTPAGTPTLSSNQKLQTTNGQVVNGMQTGYDVITNPSTGTIYAGEYPWYMKDGVKTYGSPPASTSTPHTGTYTYKTQSGDYAQFASPQTGMGAEVTGTWDAANKFTPGVVTTPAATTPTTPTTPTLSDAVTTPTTATPTATTPTTPTTNTDNWKLAVLGGLTGLGAIGAYAGSKAQANAIEEAGKISSASAAGQTALQGAMYNQSRADFKPYQDLGTAALPALQQYDQFYGVGDPVSYDKEYTQNLWGYNEDPATAAQKALGQQSLQRQLNARGLNYGATGASAGAELDQKFDVQGYDKYKSQLSDRYKALQGEYSLRRDKATTGYQQLLDQVKIGQGAANSAGAANNQYATQGTQTLQNLGDTQANLATQSGANQANFYNGLGALPGQVVNAANSINTLGGMSMFSSGNSNSSYAVNPEGTTGTGPWAQGVN